MLTIRDRIAPEKARILINNWNRASTSLCLSTKTDYDYVPVVKLVMPDGGGAWLLTEMDPDRDIAFGLIDTGICKPEMGFISLKELESIKGALGLSVEIDGTFEGKHPISHYADIARHAGMIVTVD